MMSCVYRGLRETYPKHVIKLIASEVYLGAALIDVAEHNPYIDEIHCIEPWEGTTITTRERWAQFANAPDVTETQLWKSASVAIDLNTACIAYEVEACQRGGLDKPRWEIWCDHAGVKPSSYAPIYRVTPSEAEAACQLVSEHWNDGRPVVGVGLASADKRRALNVQALRDICAGLKDQGYRPVTIDTTVKIDGYDYLIGKRIKELMPLIAQMSAVVSADSGVLHMAGTLGVPVIGIFGPTDYRMRMGNYRGSAIDSRTLMSCAPCWYDYPCLRPEGNGHKALECLSKITPELVVEETRRWITGGQ